MTFSIPGTSGEERSKLLNFVIVGGGPTGVEVNVNTIVVYRVHEIIV
jgi:NADH dehydrogenase FAD-containing subunit